MNEFSSSYRTVATASDDAQIKLWDIETGELQGSLRGHTDSVQDIIFDSTGKILGK